MFDALKRLFDGLESVFDGLKRLFNGLETVFDGLKRLFDGLETVFDGLKTVFAGPAGRGVRASVAEQSRGDGNPRGERDGRAQGEGWPVSISRAPKSMPRRPPRVQRNSP
jgi:hypothetical protein